MRPLLLLLLLTGCATGLPMLTLQRPVVLLGEVHDNPSGHALRLRAFDAWLAGGARPALVLEPFDVGDQPAIDAALRREPRPDGRALVQAVLAARPAGATRAGWDWHFYEPFLDRALRLGLPVVAGNVGRDAARHIIRDGLAPAGFDAAVPEDIVAGQARAIEASHCGQVDAAFARRMAQAQVARDQQMARAVEVHAARGVVLLAGNGHVRTDIGVPRWLSAATRARSEAIGVLEPDDPRGAYDRTVVVPAAPRADPCAGLTMPVRPQ
jgi:uncharacterized iron-regulated protein